MPPRKSKQPRADLTESWDQVDSEHSISDRSTFSGSESDDEPTPLAEPISRSTRNIARSSPGLSSSRRSITPRQRLTRSSVEPELVMPTMRGNDLSESSRLGSPKKTARPVKHKPVAKRKNEHGKLERHKHTHDGSGPGWASATFGILRSICGPLLFDVWRWLQPFASLILAGMVLSFGVAFLRGYLGSLFTNPFAALSLSSTVCSVPVFNLLPFCPSGPDNTSRNPEFDQLVAVQSSFEDVLSSASTYAMLPVDMKRSEASIRDLKHVVQYSTLPSRGELVLEFEGFIETAQQAGFDLTKFNSHVGRAIDHITSTNRWTLQVMDGEAERQAGRGSVSRFMWDSVPAALGFPSKSVDEVLLNQYLRHTSAVEDEIHRLILEAQALLSVLANLDSRIDVIASITTRDGVKASGSREDLLASLYTYLGGNRGSLAKLNAQLQLLKDVSIYRKNAWNHVNAALLKLQAIQAGLEDLRERVAEPEVLGGVVVPLEQHLEHVRMGVERLETIRNEQRSVDDAKLRHVISQGGTDDSRALDGRSTQGKVIG